MRIWDPRLYPVLCTKHLLAQWRESLGMYSIIVNKKKGYSNHPAVIEYKDCPQRLWHRMELMHEEMLRRGWHPKPLPALVTYPGGELHIWEPVEVQVQKLRAKHCKCHI